MEIKKKILIVDDDKDISYSLKLQLESRGHEVLESDNEKNALKIFNENNFDFILLDMIMEKIDSGINICKEIRKKDKNVRVYLLSNVGDEALNNIDIYQYGFNGALQKPIQFSDLINIID
jgi:DNA-binding response OmpR family regulator